MEYHSSQRTSSTRTAHGVCFFTLALLTLLTVGDACAQESDAPTDFPAGSIWECISDEDAPLEIEWLGALEQDDFRHIQRLRFTSSVRDGQPQRVYALYAQPEGDGPFPAILQIHGGGQTCFPHNVAWFVRHGYACLSFDWNGPERGRSNDEVTVWSPGLTGFLPEPGADLFASRVYQASVAAIRGIDVLCRQPDVDPDRIGVQGVSWGGYLTWIVCGLDSRVKVAVAVYGIGGLADQWSALATILHRMPEPWRDTLVRELDPGVMFERIQAPVMFVSATNDFFGQLPHAEERLARLRVPHRRSYGANLMHNLEPGSVEAAMAWLDAHLHGDGAFPEEPEVAMASDDCGRLVASARVDESQAIESVFFNYGRGYQHPLLRCWLQAPARRVRPGHFEAVLPLVDSAQPLVAIAQVVYEDMGMLSSPVLEILPVSDAPGARGSEPTTDTISAWDQGPSGWYLEQGTDFTTGEASLRLTEIAGRQALVYEPISSSRRTVELATRLTADAARAKGNRRALDIWTHDLADIQVRINSGILAPDLPQYEARATGGPGWRCTRLTLSDFRPPDRGAGRPLSDRQPPSNWNETKQLRLIATSLPHGTPAVGLVRWAPAEN